MEQVNGHRVMCRLKRNRMNVNENESKRNDINNAKQMHAPTVTNTYSYAHTYATQIYDKPCDKHKASFSCRMKQ